MIVVDWGDADNRLIVWRFGEHWNAEDYLQAVKTSNALATSQPHTVDILADVRMASIPHNIFSIAVRGLRERPRNLGRVIIVTESAMWSMIYEVIGKVYGKQDGIEFVNTIDEAYTTLHYTEEVYA